MKKLVAFTAIALFALTFTACKKEYTCCYYDSTGTKISIAGYGCVTQKMKKKDMQQLEDDMNSAATLLGWSARCE